MIGETEFENGDPSMGIIHGSVVPNDEYENFKTDFLSLNESPQKPLITIKLENGEVLPTDGGGIVDYSDHTEESSDILIEMRMDTALSYQQFFKHHVERNEESFK